jgi:hypothetical protein
LQKQAGEFKKLNTELIFIFREERQGVKGLEAIKSRSKTTFTLAVDLRNKGTQAYSPKRMTFDNYVIDHAGIVQGIIAGTLKDRATAAELTKVLSKIEAKRKRSGSK